MANFRYKGRGPTGGLVEGRIETLSSEAVASQLLSTGVTPVHIAEYTQNHASVEELWTKLSARRPDLSDLILFSRQMYTLMRAGVPINQAMNGLIKSTRNPNLVLALTDVRGQLESGHELSSALARHPDIFSTLFISMVRVGENTGNLDQALLKISHYLEIEKDTRARVKSALRYPAFVVVAICVAIGIINVMVIPAFARIFERAHVELPLATRIMIASSDFFVNYWVAMLAGVIVAALAVRTYVKTERGRYLWDHVKLRIPIIGNIIVRATLARFARAFAMAVRAGVPLLQALAVVSRAVDNEFIAKHVQDMRNGIERGETLTRTAAASGMFTPLVLQMLSVGEDTGAIDDLMDEVGGFYEREVDYDVKNLSSAIEPILIVIIAGMVLVLALAVFLPMWDLAAVKLGK